MTEYEWSPEAQEVWRETNNKTSRWVDQHRPGAQPFYPPSEAPSDLDNRFDWNGSQISDVPSSHSIPPKLILDYGDGRQERIPHPSDASDVVEHHDPGPSRSRSTRRRHDSDHHHHEHSHGHSSRQHNRDKSTSSRHHPDGAQRYSGPSEPEQINVLPSKQPSSRRHHTHHRSRSLPREVGLVANNEPPVPLLPPRPGYPGPDIMVAGGSPTSSTPSPWHAPHPAAQPYSRHGPSMAYSAQNPAALAQYTSPAIYNHPPQVGPNGVIFSHSAPPLQQIYPVPYGGGVQPVPVNPAQMGSGSASRAARSRSLNMGHGSGKKARSTHSFHSDVSDGTLYNPHSKRKSSVSTAQTPVTTATLAPSQISPQSSGSFTKSIMKKIRGFADKFNVAADMRTSKAIYNAQVQQAQQTRGRSSRPHSTAGHSSRRPSVSSRY